ncbi:ubiquinone biosynthesis accessory factor UbiJ [Marinobacter qingdaonensis]|uniref:Ubiquinone biosynthesis accessory factor UbiJ n=1 Tax=Marinobacter qingdaonensis TaxID=3108486 RepID=A0ABU5NY17_9GAMM|nr:SCP2 sterol-binding domain-containing protein [Marinobacter sp. ASW11-75]MEA1080704.1 SCP2 sterol-binding domain-containing protein [Marinobacter sp. ASW11-75]
MFPGPTLLAALTGVIESALNHALELDPASRRDLLAALDGAVQIELTAPLALSVTLEGGAERVRVSSQPVESPALIIRGRPIAFAALATGDDRVIGDGRLTVQGDTALAHQLQRALNRLSPDWEAALARHLGDVPAHFLGQRVRAAVKWSRHAFAALNANVEEYVHEESRALPGRRELEATFADIDELSLRTERLQARIDQIEQLARTDQPETP